MATDPPPADERIDIPTEFAERIAAVFGLDDPPDTVWAWWRAEADALAASERTLAAADLYHGSPTRHEVHVDGEVRYAACALDAVAAAAMAGPDAVRARSVDPVTGSPVTVEFGAEGVSVAPDAAVVSFGIGRDVPDIGPSESVIGALGALEEPAVVEHLCRYGNAFESAEAFGRWVEDVEADAFAMPADALASLLYRLERAD